jgi:hypothetical protein
MKDTCPIFPAMDTEYWREHEDRMVAQRGIKLMRGVASRAPGDMKYAIQQAIRRAEARRAS